MDLASKAGCFLRFKIQASTMDLRSHICVSVVSWFLLKSSIGAHGFVYPAGSLELPRRDSCLMSSTPTTYMEALSAAASSALQRTLTLEPARGGGASGGGGATTGAVRDVETGTRYFVKAAGAGNPMLEAEYKGVKAMAETGTIRVPTPVAYGTFESRSFCLFEYLEFAGGGSQYALGQDLARMHKSTAPQFGFEVDNTIGATPQPNLPWYDNWADFWDVHRLGHMLELTGNAGFGDDKIEKLRTKTKELLSHNPKPSLLHGDLWGGNKGFCKDGDKVIPCIFDPATYYGDREADVGTRDLHSPLSLPRD